MDPVDALERVAYLLDRQLAPPQKAKAFLRAAEVVRDLPDGELERLHRAGKLGELAGVGDSTGRVIGQALDGRARPRGRAGGHHRGARR